MKTLSGVAALAAIFAFPVMAQQPNIPCLPLDVVLNTLTKEYKEELTVMAQRENGTFFLFWFSSDIWIALVSDGEHACIWAAGDNYTVLAKKPNL